MNIFIDLFSGLGGASSEFKNKKDWKVICIDNNPELVPLNRGLHLIDLSDTTNSIRMIEHMIHAIQNECSNEMIDKLIIWASPPCQQYSLANSSRTPDEFDNTLLISTLEIIEYFEPTHWIIENVKGAIEEFDDLMGARYIQRINAMYLWGKFPLLAFKDADVLAHHRKLDAKGSRLLRPNYRALIPKPVSEALYNALTQQTSILDW